MKKFFPLVITVLIAVTNAVSQSFTIADFRKAVAELRTSSSQK